MTLIVARLLLALGWLRPAAHPPIPPARLTRQAHRVRSDLIARHIHDTTYPQRIDK
jgi:hypothetical protein